MDADARKAHCQRIGALGGKATVAKHGAAHMSKIGKEGFEATTARYGDRGQVIAHLVKKGRLSHRQGFPKRCKAAPAGEPCGSIRYAEGYQA